MTNQVRLSCSCEERQAIHKYVICQVVLRQGQGKESGKGQERCSFIQSVQGRPLGGGEVGAALNDVPNDVQAVLVLGGCAFLVCLGNEGSVARVMNGGEC